MTATGSSPQATMDRPSGSTAALPRYPPRPGGQVHSMRSTGVMSPPSVGTRKVRIWYRGEVGGFEVLGDSAYGTGDALSALQQAGHSAVIKPMPLRPTVEGGGVSKTWIRYTIRPGRPERVAPQPSQPCGAAPRPGPDRLPAAARGPRARPDHPAVAVRAAWLARPAHPSPAAWTSSTNPCQHAAAYHHPAASQVV